MISINVGVLGDTPICCLLLVEIDYTTTFLHNPNDRPRLCSSLGLRYRCSGEFAWWLHQMEAFSALLAICTWNSPVTGEFPTQRPVTRSFGVFFDLCLNKRFSKQSWGWWFETPSHPLWCHSNGEFGNPLVALLLAVSGFHGDFAVCCIPSSLCTLKHYPHCWSFVRGIHRSPVDSPHKGPLMLMFNIFFVPSITDEHTQSSFRWLETPWLSCGAGVTAQNYLPLILTPR